MRKIIAVEYLSLDGVMQAPGGPEEDRSGDFNYGGWVFPYFDQSAGEAVRLSYSRPYDLLLGRRTYDIFAAYWPKVAAETSDHMTLEFAKEFNECTKFVATHYPQNLEWQNSESLGVDIIQGLEKIKTTSDRNLLVVGSSNLVHTLLSYGLVDELHLYIAPVILGKGKRLFDENSKPRSFKLVRSEISDKGVLLLNYAKEGEIKTGSF